MKITKFKFLIIVFFFSFFIIIKKIIQIQFRLLEHYTTKNIILDQIKKEEIISIVNPIDPNISMLWISNDFTKKNWPDPAFQQNQKKESLKYILEKGKGVIDCGAHIGDFGVCLAVILKNIKRSDITVYCIDPSEEKCNFMKQVCLLNNLDDTNIKIINCGLSDINGKYSIDSFSKEMLGNNTGGWEWIRDDNGTEFKTLDYLYEKKIIDEIGFFWMDAQWMEPFIIKGGSKFLTACKPYILMEYDPPTQLHPSGSTKNHRKGARKELENDPKFKTLFSKLDIKISNKGYELDDILLEFV